LFEQVQVASRLDLGSIDWAACRFSVPLADSDLPRTYEPCRHSCAGGFEEASAIEGSGFEALRDSGVGMALQGLRLWAPRVRTGSRLHTARASHGLGSMLKQSGVCNHGLPQIRTWVLRRSFGQCTDQQSAQVRIQSRNIASLAGVSYQKFSVVVKCCTCHTGWCIARAPLIPTKEVILGSSCAFPPAWPARYFHRKFCPCTDHLLD